MFTTISFTSCKIDRACQVLACDIQDSVSGITVHRQFEETIAGIMFTLDNIIGESRRLVPVDDIRNRKGALVNLKQHYTMQSEYDIHESYESSRVIDLKKARELKTEDKGSAGRTSGTEIADDYGDNVELF